MKNKIEDLRDHLFATLEALQDKDTPMEISRAKAVADVAQTIINSATVEVKFMQATGSRSASGFITSKEDEKPALPGVTVHKIK